MLSDSARPSATCRGARPGSRARGASSSACGGCSTALEPAASGSDDRARPQAPPDDRRRRRAISRRCRSTRRSPSSTSWSTRSRRRQALRLAHRRDPHADAAGRADGAASRRGSLGGERATTGLIADAAWPEVDPALLVEDEVTIAIQVNGKLRDTLTVRQGYAARGDRGGGAGHRDKVVAHPRRQATPKKVIVVPDRLVNHRRMKRLARSSPLAGRFALAGCGLHPLYAGGGAGAGRDDADADRGRADRGQGRLADGQCAARPALRRRRARRSIGSKSSSTTRSSGLACAATTA